MRSHHGRYVAWEFIGRSTHTRQHRYSWLTILIWWQPCRWSEVGHTTAEISLCQKDDFGTLMEGIDDHSSNMCLFVYCIPLDGRINHVMSCHALLYWCIVVLLYCTVLSCTALYGLVELYYNGQYIQHQLKCSPSPQCRLLDDPKKESWRWLVSSMGLDTIAVRCDAQCTLSVW